MLCLRSQAANADSNDSLQEMVQFIRWKIDAAS